MMNEFQVVAMFFKRLAVTEQGIVSYFLAGAISLCYYHRTSSAVPFGKDAYASISAAVGKDPRNTGPGPRRSLASPSVLIAFLCAGG